MIDLSRTEKEWTQYELKSINARLSRIENLLEAVEMIPVDINRYIKDEVVLFRRILDVILKRNGL